MEAIDVLEKSPLFTGVPRHVVEEIARALVLERWPRRRQIAGPSDTMKRFRIVIQGRVKIWRSHSHDARKLTLWLLGPGDGFDIVSLLDGEPHAASASALDEVRILSASIPEFRAWLERSAPLRFAFRRYAARKLRELSELATDLALHDTSARLAHLLLRYIERPPGSDHAFLDPMLQLPQEELAALIGTVRVVVSRLLADMAREGVISVHNGTLRIESLKRLVHRADGHSREDRRHGNGSRVAL
jgi:CRP/FNR family transcriptional regulator, cyclic AMP receptor protein